MSSSETDKDQETSYSPQELKETQNFMEGEYPSFELPHSSRDGVFRIEIPSISEASRIMELIKATVPDELDACHPLLRRGDKFVRFVPSLVAVGTNIPVAAERIKLKANDGRMKYYMRVALDQFKSLDSEEKAANIVANILHEIAETDYYLKSPKDTLDSKKNLESLAYFYEEDEAIANRRMLRRLRTKYPLVDLNIKYPEDQA